MNKALTTVIVTGSCAAGFALSSFAGLEAPTTRDILVVPVTATTNFNPYTGNDFSLNKVMKQVASTLVMLDDSLAPIPAIASSWTIDSKSKEITFTLEKNRRFHDSSSIESKDIFESFKNSVVGESDLTSQLIAFSKCKVVDNCLSFTAHSKSKFTLKLSDHNFQLLLRKLAGVEGSIFKPSPDPKQFIGSGPFKVILVGSDEIVTERVDQKPFFRQIVFKKVSVDKAVTDFKSGTVDLINNVEFSIDEKDVPSSAIRQDLVSVTFGLVFQTQKTSIFHNPEVRKAVGLTIDKNELVAKYGKRAIVADGLVPKGFLGYKSQSSTLDIAAAKLIIEKFVPSSRRTVTLGLRDRFKGNSAFEEFLKESFRKIGLNLEIQYDNFNAILANFKAGKKYDMTIKGDTPRYYESSTVFVPYIEGQSQNISGFKNKRLSELYFQFEKTVSQSEKLGIIDEMESIVRRDVPVLPLFYPVQSNWYQQDLVTRDFKDLSIRLWDFPYHKLARQSP